MDTSQADAVVRDFIAAWDRMDIDAVVAAFTDDAVYHNIPMAPCKGREEIRNFIDGFLGTTKSVHFEIKHQVAAGNVVMNERVDTLEMDSGTVALPVMGVFEVTDDGKISGWRDYFDMAAFNAG